MTEPLALIVEDDEDLTVIFSKALEAAGYTTMVEMDGGKAWSQLEAICPALLVLDLHLPNLSGLDILRQMRTKDCLATTIVLAVSADARMAEMAAADADLVLIKPITFSQLRDLSSRFVPVKSPPADEPIVAANPPVEPADSVPGADQIAAASPPAAPAGSPPGAEPMPAPGPPVESVGSPPSAEPAVSVSPPVEPVTTTDLPVEPVESPPGAEQVAVANPPTEQAESPPGDQVKPATRSSKSRSHSAQADNSDR